MSGVNQVMFRLTLALTAVNYYLLLI